MTRLLRWPPMKRKDAKRLPHRTRRKPVQIYLYESEYTDLRAVAAVHGRSMAAQLRLWIRHSIARFKVRPKLATVDPRQTDMFG